MFILKGSRQRQERQQGLSLGLMSVGVRGSAMESSQSWVEGPGFGSVVLLSLGG